MLLSGNTEIDTEGIGTSDTQQSHAIPLCPLHSHGSLKGRKYILNGLHVLKYLSGSVYY